MKAVRGLGWQALLYQRHAAIVGQPPGIAHGRLPAGRGCALDRLLKRGQMRPIVERIPGRPPGGLALQREQVLPGFALGVGLQLCRAMHKPAFALASGSPEA